MAPDARRFGLLLGLLAAAAFAWFEWVTWTQLASNRIFVADAGIFDFMCNSPLHGRWMMSPIHWHTGVTQFAAHYTPIFLLATPFYLLADHPMTWLTFQDAGLALAVVPLGLWARRRLRSDAAALAVAAMYATNVFTGAIHLANHQEALGALGLFTMFLALDMRRPWLFAAGMLWAFCTKETYALVTAMYAVPLLARRELRRWGACTLAVSALWWIGASLVIKHSGAEIYAAMGNKPVARYASMGDTMGEVFVHLATHPLDTLQRAVRRPLLDLFLSVGLVALLDWRTSWLVAASAALYMVADDALVRDLHYYYSYPALPFLFHSTVRGAENVLAWTEPRRALAAKCLAAAGGIAALASIPAATRTDGLRRLGFEIAEHHRFAAQAAAEIPPDAPVAVQYELYNRVPNRRIKLPMRIMFLDEVEYVLMDSTMLPADLRGNEKAAEREELYRRLQSDEWETVERIDGYVVLRKR